MDPYVELVRRALEMALLVSAPLLAVVLVVSLVVNIGQVLTSLQEGTLSTVPRLVATAAAAFLLLPWMARRLGAFTLSVFSDFHSMLR
jgi:flagellar biosynthetic protein FliQ